MICPCCQPENINDLDNTFTLRRAKKEGQAYLKNGLSKRADKLIAFLHQLPNESRTTLDIGCGVGGVHQELLRQGLIESAIGIDASSAYLQIAGQNAGILHINDQTEYHHLDFAQNADQFNRANVVILDRVICCYPHLEQLLGEAANRAQDFLAISYPIDNQISRFAVKIADFFLRLTGSGYHPFVHPEPQIMGIAANAGMQLAHSDQHLFWQIRVFSRVNPL